MSRFINKWCLVSISLMVSIQCAKWVMIDRLNIEYGLADATEVNVLLNHLGSELEQSQFALKLDPTSVTVPAGWDSLFSWIHVSDVQLRDFGIFYHGKFITRLLDRKLKGAQRVPELDKNDEVLFLALVGALNQVHPSPLFLLHTGDAIDAGSEGEALAFLFIANQLNIPWFNVIGNHDGLVFGTLATRDVHIQNPVSGAIPLMNRQIFLRMHGENNLLYPEPDRWARHPPTETFRGDMSRSFRHGFDRSTYDSRPSPRSWQATSHYSLRIHDDPPLRLLVLDTNLPPQSIPGTGHFDLPVGDQGFIAKDEFTWLETELNHAAQENELVFLAGHHPLTDESMKPQLKGEIGYEKKRYLIEYLKNRPEVLAYFGGHVHRPYLNAHQTVHGTFLEVIAPSLHEYPLFALHHTIFRNRWGKIGFRILPTQGEVIDGVLQSRYITAIAGALKEAGKIKVRADAGQTVSRFIILK